MRRSYAQTAHSGKLKVTACIQDVHLDGNGTHMEVTVVQILHCTPVPVRVGIEEEPLQYTALAHSLTA